MDDKRNKHQTSGQVDHVDQILNEIMQNRERRTNNNNNNSTSYDWLESDSYGTTQQLDSNIQEWHPEQHLEQIGDHRIDYYLDYGSKVIPDHHLQQQPHQNQNQQQLLQNQNQQYHHNHQNHQQQHQQSMYQNFHDYHDQSLLNNSGYYDVNSSNIPSLSSSSSSASNSTSSSSRYNPDPMIHNINRGQPAARHHIQQVHPRNSALHSTNPATRQSQQPPQVLDRGIYQRNGPSSYSPSPPPPPPANLLVHQQYRPSPPPPQHRQYDDRYSHQQHTSSLQSLQQTQGQSNSQNPQYSNMSHYDLSAHVRNQGALNWSTGSIPILGGNNGIGNGNGNNNNNLNNRQLNLNSSSNSSISSSSSTSAANRARYQNSPTTSLSYPNNNGNNNMNNININNNNPSNFLVNGGLGNNNNNNNNNTRSLLVHPSGIQASQSRGNNNNGNNSNNNSPNNILNRNNDMAGRDIELEQLIYRNAKAILAETANRCLKSVELANALRDRIGKEALQRTKVLYGGLLVLLELYRETFAVHRIPKNDMVELLAYVPPQYSTHNIQHPQQLLASQIPGYNITTPNLTTNNSFPNGSLLNGVNATYPSNKDNTVPITSNPNQSLQTSNQLLNLTTSSLIQTLTSQQVPTKCLFISNIPDEISGNQIWAEFGGENIVEKVSIDFQGNQRTGVVWFTSVNAAKAALNIPSLIKWKDVLSFIDPADVAPPTIISSTLSENSGDIEVINTTDNAQSIINLQSQSNSNNNNNNRNDHNNNNINISIDDPYGPPPGLSEPTNLPYLPGRVNGNGNNNSNNNNGGKNPFFDVVVAMPDNFNFISNDNIDDNLNLVVDLTSLTISDSHSDGYTGTPITSAEQSPNDSPRGNFRKAAPPPILTSDLNSLSAESLTPNSGKSLSPSGSPNSTPGGTPNLSFTFFDSSAPGGITTLPKETLPKVIHDVMNTLCDIYYVPQKTWEKSPIGDYLFCQAIVDILSGQFNGVFVQMTKLKQQLKRKLGGSIRIGPLKALVIAYPEYFEVDRTVNLVRSLKTELPYMDISVITSA